MGVFEILAKGVGTVLLTATGVASWLVKAIAESGGVEDIAELANQGKEKSFHTIQQFWSEKPNVELTEEQLERRKEVTEDINRRKRIERIERERKNLQALMRKATQENNEGMIEAYEKRLDRLDEIQEHLMDS